jgi:nitrate/nitrite-specific signal transduction histidine kinase
VIEWLPHIVARIRASVHTKLLSAFLIIVLLLLGAAGAALQALAEVNRRAEDMVKLQRKIAAYRQLNHDTTGQLYSVASSLVKADEAELDATLRQLKQFGYDLDRLQFVAQTEKDVMRRARADYESFINIVTRAVELIRAGKSSEGRDMQLIEAAPLAERLDRLTNELVNKAEADMVVGLEARQQAYARSQRTVIAVALATVALALLLGYAMSQSLINPVKQMETRMREIAAGKFSLRVDVPNRDELGALAADLNRMSAELGRLYGQLEAANRHKSEFLASMSHELRTPLSAIIGFSEALNDGMFGASPAIHSSLRASPAVVDQ